MPKGFKHSQEAIDKIKRSHQGKHLSPGHCAAIKAAQNRPEVKAKKSKVHAFVTSWCDCGCGGQFRAEITSKGRSKRFVSGGHNKKGVHSPRPSVAGENNPMKRPEVRLKQRENCRRGDSNPMNRPDVRIKQRESLNRPDIKIKMIKAIREALNRPEVKAKHSAAQKGEKNGNWRGGTSLQPWPFEFNGELKEFVRKRDNYCCRLCGRSEKDNGRKLDVHHINYDKNNLEKYNLISLCCSCHCKTNGPREKWPLILSEIICSWLGT